MSTGPPNHSSCRAASFTAVARLRLACAIQVVAALLAGCAAPGPTPPPSPPPTAADTPSPAIVRPSSRLAILAGNPRDGGLVLVDDSGVVRTVPLPVASTTWISSDRAGRLVATSADGQLFLSDPVANPGEIGWREVVPGWADARPADPLSFATISPDGRTIAALAADFAAGTDFDLVLVDLETGAAAAIRVNAWPDGAAPAWLPDGRLFLVARDPARDLTGLVLVDPERPGAALRFEREAYGIALSADGQAAAIDRADGRVAAGATRLLLGDGAAGGGDDPSRPDDPPGLLVSAPPGTAPGSFALDPSGTRLAIAWLDEAGGPATVGRYRLGADGPVAETPVAVAGGATRVVPAWLP